MQKPSRSSNPLLDRQSAFLTSLETSDRENFFNDEFLSPERRAKIWGDQAQLGTTLINRYAWATPTKAALHILQAFGPLIEIGCGANAYWCRQMKQYGVDIVGYDLFPNEGGQLDEKKNDEKSLATTPQDFLVQKGGPEMLAKHPERTLFLCYPDENVVEEDNPLGAACLEQYKGEVVIHVGELFLDANLSWDQSPYGRSSSPDFQERLATEFHCILKIELPNWLHSTDRLTVWKRSATCTMVFEGDSHDQDEQVVYRHIPVQERLSVNVAAPCMQKLLDTSLRVEEEHIKSDNDDEPSEQQKNDEKEAVVGDNKKRHKPTPKESKVTSSTYTCPW